MSEETFQKNVLGEKLEPCSLDPLTGWFRNGDCKTDYSDIGQHTICCVMTNQFLTYSNRTITIKKLAHAALNFKTESSYNDLKSIK